jgi:DNA-binding LacI/PurR family transcriptional regulator
MPLDPKYIFFECIQFEDGVKVVQQLTEMPEPPTALLVTSDTVAAGIITYCKEKEISIPNELAIMGFDNQPVAKIMHITTLEIPLVEIGKNYFFKQLTIHKILTKRSMSN